jgi:cytochrome c oxidase subunit 3
MTTSGVSGSGLVGNTPSGARPTALDERKNAHPDHRRETAELGMWIFLASELLFFGGLLFAYLYGRSHWPAGFAEASKHTDVVIGTVNTAILLTSSAFAAAAVELGRASSDDGRRGRRAWITRLLWLTALFGAVFLALKGFEWHSEWREGLFPGPDFHLEPGQAAPAGAQMFFVLYFVMTGLHALHMIIGVVTFAVLGKRSYSVSISKDRLPEPVGGASPSDARDHDLAIPVEMAALYWHFVDVVWIVLYPLLYLVERHA